MWLQVVLLGMACAAAPALGSGKIDPGYGGAGTLHTQFDDPQYGLDGGFQRLLPAPGDRLYVISAMQGDNCCYAPALEVNLVDRHGDSVWDRLVHMEPAALGDVVVTPDGGLLIGGGQPAGNVSGGFIAALDANGSPEPRFDGSSELPLDAPVSALALQPDGRLLVASPGRVGFSSEGTELCLDEGWTLRRMDSSGLLDPGFGTDGRLRSAQVDSRDGVNSCRISRLFLEPDGRIVLEGHRTYRLNANGSVDSSFRNGDQLSLGNGPFMRLQGGGWLTVDSLPRGSETETRLTRYDIDGALDRSFGMGGSGLVTIDLGEIGTGDAAAWDEVSGSYEISDDGSHYFATAWTYLRTEAFDPLPSGQVVARLLRDGRLDETFGRDGVVRLTTGTQLVVAGMVPQSDGGLIVATRDRVFRLFGADEPSPGAIDARPERPVVFEDAGSARVIVSRNAGADTPISVAYHTVQVSASPGADYQAVVGRLDWAAGDSTDRVVEIPVTNDDENEPSIEVLRFELIVESGGAMLFAPSTQIGIADDGDPVRGTGGNTGGGGSGGGSAGLALLALLASLVAERRRRWRRTGQRHCPSPAAPKPGQRPC
jgi:uncharacterized delta-60 repeat protein